MNRETRPDKSPTPILSAQEREWLETQQAFGVDVVVDDRPHVYLSAQKIEAVAETPPMPLAVKVSSMAALRQKKPSSKAKPSPRESSVPLSRARAEAERIAAEATSLEELRELVAQFDGCPLKATASNLVFGAGSMNPVVMLIGEGPGAEEDRRGEPFVGASGRLMLRTLEVFGLRRSDNVYISNTVYWRPPADRTPQDTEIAACLPFLRKQIALVNPKLLVLVGARAAQTLMGTTAGITRVRGAWVTPVAEIVPNEIPALPVFHPAYLFRNHAQKRLFWHDMLRIRQKIDELAIDVPWPAKGLDGFADDWQL